MPNYLRRIEIHPDTRPGHWTVDILQGEDSFRRSRTFATWREVLIYLARVEIDMGVNDGQDSEAKA